MNNADKFKQIFDLSATELWAMSEKDFLAWLNAERDIPDTNVGDLISRQAAIKAVDDLPNCYNGYSDTYDKAYIIGVLEEVPRVDVPERKVGEWDMFELITSVFFGKQYYFVEENGIVYSRETHKYMTKDDAISEFLGIIGE